VSLLAFDTATPATVVGLAVGGDEVIEARHDPAPGERPGHGPRVLELVDEVMGKAGAGWEDVGPGSFTGLRIGIATARGLAQARGLKLAAVSTLEALAGGAAGLPDVATVLALVDARRGEAFAAAFAGGEAIAGPAAVPGDELAAFAAGLPGPVLAVGDGAIRFRAQIEPAGPVVPPDGDPLHAVGARQLCRLAAAAPAGPPDAVLPQYLRLPDAERDRRLRSDPGPQ
jgi:tRNA threonylcarbamoyladenosine biosynthesis protein TsaB